MIRYQNYILQDPEALWLLLPALILMMIVFSIRSRRKHEIGRKTVFRPFMFFWTMLILALLAIAASSPAIEESVPAGQVQMIKILVDNTTSMQVYDTDVGDIVSGLGEKGILTEVSYISTADSALGDELLKKLSPEQDILFVTDGMSNRGASMSDVAILAANMGSRIFSLRMRPERHDQAVVIEGPDKVISGADTEFIVRVMDREGKGGGKLRIRVDQQVVFEGNTEGYFYLNESFIEGEHKISAEIDDDFFPQNNEFHKVISVVDKPAVLYLGRNSKTLDFMSTLYDLDVAASLPDDLDKYYSIIMNDVDAKSISDNDLEQLEAYLEEGNGLLVIGGKSSYDTGGYNSSMFSSLLPVNVGEPKKKKDSVSIIMALDTGVSGAGIINTTGSTGVSFIDVQKALAIEVLRSISGTSRVGIVESNTNPSIVSKLSELGPKLDELSDLVSKVKLHDATRIYDSISISQQLLRLERGSKNIIVITDGNVGKYDQGVTLKAVDQAASEGIKIFTIGVGQDADQRFLEEMARRGNGRYFQTDQRNRLNIFFGDPDHDNQGKMSMFIYDINHFITSKIDTEIPVTGYNSVYPKGTAQLLVTTTNGDPLLTVWRVGLGRVASLSTSPDYWAGDMLRRDKSELLARTVNWLIENPERKDELILDIPDLRENRSSVITAYSEEMPEGLPFFEEKQNVFKAYYYPEHTGFVKILGRSATVNYDPEFDASDGEALKEAVQITGGRELSWDPATIAEELEGSSDAETIKTTDLSWIFAVLAISLYLFEIVARKVREIRIARSL